MTREGRSSPNSQVFLPVWGTLWSVKFWYKLFCMSWAAFFDSITKALLLLTQVYAVNAFGNFCSKMCADSAANERNFAEKRQKHYEWLIETGHPLIWSTNYLENFIPAFRKVQRASRFWNRGGGGVLFTIFIVAQLFACLALFNVDFFSGLR